MYQSREHQPSLGESYLIVEQINSKFKYVAFIDRSYQTIATLLLRPCKPGESLIDNAVAWYEDEGVFVV